MTPRERRLIAGVAVTCVVFGLLAAWFAFTLVELQPRTALCLAVLAGGLGVCAVLLGFDAVHAPSRVRTEFAESRVTAAWRTAALLAGVGATRAPVEPMFVSDPKNVAKWWLMLSELRHTRGPVLAGGEELAGELAEAFPGREVFWSPVSQVPAVMVFSDVRELPPGVVRVGG